MDNIGLIGDYNPYRKRKVNKEKYELSLSDDKDNELVYLVLPLPKSLLHCVFSFGAIDDEKNKISQYHFYLRKKFDPSVVSLREIERFTKCVLFFKDILKSKIIKYGKL